MPNKPPVRGNIQLLPFRDADFSWQTFEDFFCAFLAAQPTLEVFRGGKSIKRQIKSVRPYGKRGQNQKGIDLCAQLEGELEPEIWAFQCKHYAKWTKALTEQALAKCKFEAAHKFLLVTSDVGDDCRKVIARHPDWTLWDQRDITQEFLKLQPERVAAGILYRCFGPGWDKKFFNIPGHGPFFTPDAFFKPWRKKKLYFHHNLPLVGRKDGLHELDDFVRSQSRLLLLTGKGGGGKSKLLFEWSRTFSRHHKGRALLFASRETDDFSEYLGATEEKTVVVLDDAHQEGSLRVKLFEAAVRLDDIKLILALRPGPNDAVIQELISVGYDVSEIEEPPTLEKLSDDEALRLAQESLRPRFSRYVEFLYHASRDCPLIAVVGGAMIQKGDVTSAGLAANEDIRSAVFDKLRKQADLVAQNEFPKQNVSELLSIISLLSPVENTPEFRQKAAEVMGGNLREHYVSRLIDRLMECEILRFGKSGLRITPDLLSDDIAYRACYDSTGKATGFAKLIIDHFEDQSLEIVARHLAETEWRAQEEHQNRHDSIIEPIVQMFRSRFAASTFTGRGVLLDRWGQIATLRPRETIDFVDLALKSTTAPAPAKDAFEVYFKYAGEINNYSSMLEHLPSLLRAVGGRHAEFVEPALDRLWQMARIRDDDESRNQNHPLAAMADICKYENWKSPAINRAALEWLERLFAGVDWLSATVKPLVVVQVLLKPFLATWVETTLWMRRKAIIQTLPIQLGVVKEFRHRVFAICKNLIQRRNPILAVAVIGLADEASLRLRSPLGGSTSPKMEADWLPERMEALELFSDIIRETDQPAVHLSARKELMEYLRRKDAPEFLARCRELIGAVPDTLESRIMRALFSSDHEEFGDRHNPREDEDCKAALAREEQQWKDFLKAVAREIVQKSSNVDEIGRLLQSAADRGSVIRWDHPRFRELVEQIVVCHPSLGLEFPDFVLSNPSHSLASIFDFLVHTTTVDDLSRRLDLYRRATAIHLPQLQACVVYGMNRWRTDSALPDGAWQILIDLAVDGTSEISWAIASFIEFHAKKAEKRDFDLLLKIPIHEQFRGIAIQVLDSLGEILRHHPEAKDIVAMILEKFVSFKDLDQDRFQIELSELARHVPEQIFYFLFQRYSAGEANQFGLDYEALPFWTREMPIGDLLEGGCGDLFEEISQRLLSNDVPDANLTRLLQAAVFNGKGSSDALLNDLLEKADSAPRLLRLMKLLTYFFAPIVLGYPFWAKSCILKARQFGEETYASVKRSVLANATSGSNAFTNGEPDSSTIGHVEKLEKLAHEYADDTELGAIFSEAATRQRAFLKYHKDEFLKDLADE